MKKKIEINWWVKNINKNVCRDLNYIDHSLIAISIITGCVFISALTSLIGIPIESTSSAVGFV